MLWDLRVDCRQLSPRCRVSVIPTSQTPAPSIRQFVIVAHTFRRCSLGRRSVSLSFGFWMLQLPLLPQIVLGSTEMCAPTANAPRRGKTTPIRPAACRLEVLVLLRLWLRRWSALGGCTPRVISGSPRADPSFRRGPHRPVVPFTGERWSFAAFCREIHE